MTRSIDLELAPAAHRDDGRALNVYTYERGTAMRPLTESVFGVLTFKGGYAGVELTPDEARVLANQLLQVADQAESQKELNEALDDIEDRLRDPNFDTSLVRFCHPDVVYAAPDRLLEVAQANPGKLVIEEARAEVTQ
jgi:hypothetical protein